MPIKTKFISQFRFLRPVEADIIKAVERTKLSSSFLGDKSFTS